MYWKYVFICVLLPTIIQVQALSPPCPRSPCPTNCVTEFTSDPLTGCPTCQCIPETCNVGEIKKIDCNTCMCVKDGWACTRMKCGGLPAACPPIDPAIDCPMDCGIEIIRDPFTGCETCRCDPNDTSNPFGCPPSPCPADCTTEFIKDPRGCFTCQCIPEKCKDETDNCAEYLQHCDSNDVMRQAMKKICAASCKFCKKEIPGPVDRVKPCGYGGTCRLECLPEEVHSHPRPGLIGFVKPDGYCARLYTCCEPRLPWPVVPFDSIEPRSPIVASPEPKGPPTGRRNIISQPRIG